MPRKAIKTDSVFRIIQERIDRGDYRQVAFPSERKLAKQLGVSHPTARKAVQQAVDAGVLQRGETGRLVAPARSASARGLQFALICPAEASPAVLDWMKALRVLADRRSAVLRVYHFIDGNDQLLTDALGADFDLYFLIPPNTINRVVEDMIRDRKERVVSLFTDLRRLGVPCVDNTPVEGIDVLVDHLVGLGHRRIACVTCEAEELPERVERYRAACKRHGLEALVTSEHNPPDWISAMRGYRFMTRELKQRTLLATAYLFTTIEPGLGCLRACHEAGVVPGRDLSICAFGPSLRARLTIPALTTLQTPSHETVLSDVVDTILLGGESLADRERHWQLSVFPGESCGRIAASPTQKIA